MSVIDVALRISQCHPMVTHDEILDELIRRLNAKQVTGKGIADLLGIAPARVTEMRKRERRVQQNEMPILAELFGLGSVEPDDMSDVVWVPIIGQASAGVWRDAIEIPTFVVPQIRRKGTNQAFGVVVDGDSMDRVMQPGAYAIIDPDQRRPMDKRVYLIQNGGGETTIKRFREGPPRFEPDSRNPMHKTVVGQFEISLSSAMRAKSVGCAEPKPHSPESPLCWRKPSTR